MKHYLKYSKNGLNISLFLALVLFVALGISSESFGEVTLSVKTTGSISNTNEVTTSPSQKEITNSKTQIEETNKLSIAKDSTLNELGAQFIAHFDETVSVDIPIGITVENYGGTIIPDGISNGALRLDNSTYIAIDPKTSLSQESGTLMFWLRPHWNYDPNISHTFVSHAWSDDRKGYFVLSDGWWEWDGGGPYTYLIYNNQDYIKFNKTIWYGSGTWMHIAYKWKVGDSGFVKLYLNGSLAGESTKKPYKTYPLKGNLYLGADKGTPLNNDRWGNCDIDELAIFNRDLSDDEIFLAYNKQQGSDNNIVTDRTSLKREARVMFDENAEWMTEAGAKEAIRKIKEAGFNVYVPCVWHGRGTRYPTSLAHPEGGKPFTNSNDPLARLITIAHENEIEVHPWFCVVLRQDELLKDYYASETPEDAFDVHRPQFKKFIVDLILDVATRYNIDGINLDYIRTMGICKCTYCIKEYNSAFSRSLLSDIQQTSANGRLESHLQTWQDEAVYSIVKEISQKVKKIKSHLIISVDGHPRTQYDVPNSEGRQEIKWANDGIIDVIFNMEYSKNPDFEKHRFIKTELDDPSKLILLLGNYENIVTPRSAELLIKLVDNTKQQWPDSGIGIYFYSILSNDQIKSLAKEPFAIKATPYWPGD